MSQSDVVFCHHGEGKKNLIEPHVFGSVWLKLISSCAMMETVVSVFVCSNGCVFNKSNLFFNKINVGFCESFTSVGTF